MSENKKNTATKSKPTGSDLAKVDAYVLGPKDYEDIPELTDEWFERADLYRERSPIHFAERLERPMLILQGLDDKIVLPEQSELMVAALARKGIPHAYLPFEGEGHGFRVEENIVRALEASLSFVGQVFGFEPADEIEPLELSGDERLLRR